MVASGRVPGHAHGGGGGGVYACRRRGRLHGRHLGGRRAIPRRHRAQAVRRLAPHWRAGPTRDADRSNDFEYRRRTEWLDPYLLQSPSAGSRVDAVPDHRWNFRHREVHVYAGGAVDSPRGTCGYGATSHTTPTTAGARETAKNQQLRGDQRGWAGLVISVALAPNVTRNSARGSHNCSSIQACWRRRAKPTSPTRPVAISIIVAGSGVTATGLTNDRISPPGKVASCTLT